MDKHFYLVPAMAVSLVLSLMASSSVASCLRWETVCHYDCIEYYPNGTDCKKTKKWCERVCAEDSFDVDRGGIDDANRSIKSQSVSPSSGKRSYLEPEIVISGRLERSTIDKKEIWIVVPSNASGVKIGAFKVYEIDPGKTPIKSFENTLVEVTGRLSWTINDKKGYLPSLTATSIRVSKDPAQ